MTAFKTLLYRHSGQSDLIVGTAISNRSRSEIEGLIGSFTNSIILRTNLSGDPSFTQLLDQVSEVFCSAFTNRNIQFEKLVQELNPHRDPSYNPIYQVVFTPSSTITGPTTKFSQSYPKISSP